MLPALTGCLRAAMQPEMPLVKHPLILICIVGRVNGLGLALPCSRAGTLPAAAVAKHMALKNGSVSMSLYLSSVQCECAAQVK